MTRCVDNPNETHQDFPAVIDAAAAEVTRQEARVDTKAAQLATLAGTLSTLSVGAATGISVLAPRVGAGVLLLVLPLLLAAVAWSGSVVVLLCRIVRPRLAATVRGSFAQARQMEELQALSLAEYRQQMVSGLGSLVLARYRAVRLATDLLVAGFAPLLLAGITAVAIALVRAVY